jgi:hypothetical protein
MSDQIASGTSALSALSTGEPLSTPIVLLHESMFVGVKHTGERRF